MQQVRSGVLELVLQKKGRKGKERRKKKKKKKDVTKEKKKRFDLVSGLDAFVSAFLYCYSTAPVHSTTTGT